MYTSEYVLTHFVNQLDTDADIQEMCIQLNDHPNAMSFLAISEVLTNWGIENVVFACEPEDIVDLQEPFIVYLSSRGGEFAIVKHVDDNLIRLSGEWYDDQAFSIDDFRAIYGGLVLITDKEGKDSAGSFSNATLPYETTYIDIGASYGLHVKWEQFTGNPMFNLILVEPGEFWANELRRRYPRATVVPHALGDKNDRATLNIAAARSCSSLLEPNMEFLERFPISKGFRVVDTEEVEIYRYEDIAPRENVRQPDFVKIDVQGFEYEVLEGFGNILDGVLGIELECHLVPVYKNEKTLTEINAYLETRGFYLRHLDNVGAFEGQVVEFNGYFARKPETLVDVQQQEMIKWWEGVNHIPPPKTI
jgi:FkbM family methyltransferase